MTAAAVLTPFDRGNAIELGNRLWRKRVLPVGDVEYQGRMLHFTPSYLADLETAFRSRAYDQVPFQLADAKNTHTNDPERTRGFIVDMRAEQDGLYVTLNPTESGEKVLKENPYLGVSARIVEDYARSDGQHYPAAVQHVLGTLDPRIPGLGAWQSIEAANTPEIVIDLTAAHYAGQGEEGSTMPEMSAEHQARLAKLLNLPDDKLDALVASLDGSGNGETAIQDLLGGDSGEIEISDEELAEIIASMPDEELAALEQEYMVETQTAGASAGLSYEAQMAIDLANARADETDRQLGVLQAEHARQRFENEKRQFADIGVPPYITDLARPLLEGSGHAVELANGQRADAGAVMRRVLTEYGKMAGMLDLGIEMGSPMDEPMNAQSDARAGARDEIISRAKGQMGLLRLWPAMSSSSRL